MTESWLITRLDSDEEYRKQSRKTRREKEWKQRKNKEKKKANL